MKTTFKDWYGKILMILISGLPFSRNCDEKRSDPETPDKPSMTETKCKSFTSSRFFND